MLKYFIICLLSIVTVNAMAAGGGGHSFGLGLGFMSPTQSDLDTVTDEINSSESRSINKLSTAYEMNANYQYRFASSMFALQIRPSYFTQTATGSSYDTKLTGFSIFPTLKLYPLENAFIKFYLQTGVGYGRLSGSMSGPNGKVEWAGGAFGAQAGLGAEFCFSASHCMILEGIFRYLPIERNIVTGQSGTVSGFDTPVAEGELENGSMDVKTSMSGIQGALSYQMYF